MSADMIVFNNPEFGEVRRVEIDGEYWLVGVDVCRSLGYQKPHNALKKHVDREDSLKRGVLDAYGFEQPTIIINESGVYSLIFASKLPNAKKFKKWVTSEVLPSIRKTGTYTAPAAPAPAPMSPAQLIAAQAQILVDMEQKMLAIQDQTQAIQNQMEAARSQYDALSQKVDTAVKVLARPTEDHWRADVDEAIKELAKNMGWTHMTLRGRMYKDLEQKVNCNLQSRVDNLRARKKKQGCRHKDAMAFGKLDAIAADKSLRAAFELVLKEWQTRYMVMTDQQEDYVTVE